MDLLCWRERWYWGRTISWSWLTTGFRPVWTTWDDLIGSHGILGFSHIFQLSDPTVGNRRIRHPTTSGRNPVLRKRTISDRILSEVIGLLGISDRIRRDPSLWSFALDYYLITKICISVLLFMYACLYFFAQLVDLFSRL